MYDCRHGSVLWDYSSHRVNMFYTALRKCIRCLFVLPARTHCALLPGICNDVSAEGKLHVSFLFLFRTCLNSNNLCTNLCTKLALQESRSDAAKSANCICSKYNFNEYDIANAQRNGYIVNDFLSSLYVRARRYC